MADFSGRPVYYIAHFSFQMNITESLCFIGIRVGGRLVGATNCTDGKCGAMRKVSTVLLYVINV